MLRTEQDFYDLAAACAAKAHSQNVRYAEIFFDPQAHTARGVAFDTVIRGLTRDPGPRRHRARHRFPGPPRDVLPARLPGRIRDDHAGAGASPQGVDHGVGLDSDEVSGAGRGRAGR
ncbi:hypothetical protein [Streptomyces sp. NPDC001750]|uniref:hypothetical protein n=1 Tax=Streptomyces sp. NPDC001750 TaxID=3364607 RepID=UPI00367F066A